MKQHTLFWGSSYDRGLDMLLYIWDDVLKAYPDAKLHITYGWDLFDKMAANNPERQEWKKNVQALMGQDGIEHHGRVSKQKLQKIRKGCGIWAYPTYFTEINCITALDCQADGVVPVVCNFKDKGRLTALDETVKSGVKVEGAIRDKKTIEKFKDELIKLMGNKKRWEEERVKGKEFAKKFEWPEIARKWNHEFKKPVDIPLVSIITPTIRKGFWNIMAQNISTQTYKNVEWIVVDDYPTNRALIADEYAKKYGIKIKYLQGNKKENMNYGLSTANNIGWRNAEGSLCVWLQDFVLMPPTGIEQLVDIHRHNPDCIIAPCDEYYRAKIKPDTNSEDWFDGKTDIVGEFMRRNQRVLRLGMRHSTNHYELELNYGAIPRHILKDLNGFWEFFDDGLGFDDTEILYRAFKAGYGLIVDDSNICKCIDHWEPLKDKQEELGKDRTINLNDPRFMWLMEKMKKGMSYKRDEKLDKKLDYSMPKDLNQEDAVKWMRKNIKKIVEGWM
jgi:glycosyltransferase involved in cell wall biosynthesis